MEEDKVIAKLKVISDRCAALSAKLADSAVIGDPVQWAGIAKEQAELSEPAEVYAEYIRVRDEMSGAAAAAESESDPEMRALLQEEAELCRQKLEDIRGRIKIILLPKDRNDDRNCIVEIRGGAGGEEAALFAGQLYEMYLSYCDRHRLKCEEVDINRTELGGVKEVVFNVAGKGAYKLLKFESGVHRVQRVPETESQGRVHTSTATVAVLPEAEDVEVNINENDLKIDTYRSGGAGGQHVNKTESAIRITHLPTGIVVECQDERSQIKNREKAMKVLRSRLYDFYRSQADKEYAETRRAQVGTGDRSERIRTYNFPQGRVTDHRIGLTLYSLDRFMLGDMDEMVAALQLALRNKLLESIGD